MTCGRVMEGDARGNVGARDRKSWPHILSPRGRRSKPISPVPRERCAMSNASEAGAAARPPLAEKLAQSADGVLEQIAREYGVSTFEVVRALPAEHRGIVPG